jgi:hypothetical protein
MAKLRVPILVSTVITLAAAAACDPGTGPVPIASISVTSPAQSVIVTREVQISARALAADGQELPARTFTWSSDDTNIASVSTSGLVRGVAPGTTAIRANAGGQSGRFDITVIRAPVTQITIEPAAPSVTMTSTVQLTARVQDANGGFPTDRTITWASNNTAVATVNGGIASGIAPGTATIFATTEGVQGQVTLTVNPPPFAVALPDGRVRIHPSVVNGSGFDGSPLWLAWMGNDFLRRLETDPDYRGLTPNPINRLQRINAGEHDGWYETLLPVVGSCFTVVQFAGTTRRWANLDLWAGRSGTFVHQEHQVMKLPDDGQAAARLNSLVRVYIDGDRRYAFVSNALLPTESLNTPWKLVGNTNDWSYATGRAVSAATSGGFSFDASGYRRYANVRATSTAGREVWGLFNMLADRSIDLTNAGCTAPSTGYKHPNLHTDGTSTGIWFEPPEMPEHLPHLFVNQLEGMVGWPNPNQPPNSRTVGTYRAATPWLTMVDDMRAPEPSSVEVDYLRLWAVVGGQDVRVAENNYSDGRFGGTLASRDQWFATRWDEIKQRASVSNGVLRLPLSTASDRAWHVWLVDSWPTEAGPHWRHLLPENTERVWVEARVRIRGPAALQLGWDYYRTTNDVGCDVDMDGVQEDGWCEAGKTHWIFESFDNEGWQTVTLGK